MVNTYYIGYITGMKKDVFGYITVFALILVGALAIVVPGVESAPLQGQSFYAMMGEPQEVSEGVDIEQQLSNQRFPFQFSTGQIAENNDAIGENVKKVEELYRFINRNFIHELDHDHMYEELIKALFSALDDPYSSFIPEERATRITDTTTGVYGGIGAYISKPDPAYRDEQPSSYMVTVVAPFQGSPAYRAGLHAGDLISHIDGEDVFELTAEEASKLLRGQEGTDVEVTVYRSESVSYEISITREIVTVPTVEYDMIGSTGYLKILQFTPITPEKFLEAIKAFREDGYDSLIIDVRQNPGGEFHSVRQIADYILNDGIIVSTESRVPGQSRVYRSTPQIQIPPQLPIIVLVDGGSASGSEILAGALQDNLRATVIGENTFGKGYVQGVYPFASDYFRLTISKYVTPLEQDIETSGITPDIISKRERLSDEESKAASNLFRSKLLGQFVDDHPDMEHAPIDDFIVQLQEEGYELSERYLQMLITQEYYTRMDFPPIYNLDQDDTLNRALEELGR